MPQLHGLQILRFSTVGMAVHTSLRRIARDLFVFVIHFILGVAVETSPSGAGIDVAGLAFPAGAIVVYGE
jgi:hypothetical protein